jgi:hypothetical protein
VLSTIQIFLSLSLLLVIYYREIVKINLSLRVFRLVTFDPGSDIKYLDYYCILAPGKNHTSDELETIHRLNHLFIKRKLHNEVLSSYMEFRKGKYSLNFFVEFVCIELSSYLNINKKRRASYLNINKKRRRKVAKRFRKAMSKPRKLYNPFSRVIFKWNKNLILKGMVLTACLQAAFALTDNNVSRFIGHLYSIAISVILILFIRNFKLKGESIL